MLGTKTFVIPFETVRNHAEWSEKTFGPEKGPAGPLRHLAKEAAEAAEATTRENRLEELADCTFLLLDAIRRGNYTAEELADAMDRKQVILNGRVYQRTAEGEPSEHDRSIPDIA